MTHPLWPALVVAVWGLHFTALYGFTALACARDLRASLPWVAGGASVAALVAIALIAGVGYRHRTDFNGWLTLALAALALVAVMFETLPLFMVPACV